MTPTVESFCEAYGGKPFFESQEAQEEWSREFHLNCLEACNENYPQGRFTAYIRSRRPEYVGPKARRAA